MPTPAPKFSLSRNEAAELLAISTRTLDRYIRSKKLTARKKGGAILLSEEEVGNLKVALFQNMHGASPEVEGRAHRHIDSVSARANATIFDSDTGLVEENPVAVTAPAQKDSVAKGAREQVFEELYDLSRREIREYNNKLEAANYRLGQMETQLKHSVPLLEYQEKEAILSQQDQLIQGKVKHQEEALSMMEQEIRSERLNKNVYIGLVFGLLALQPILWLLLS